MLNLNEDLAMLQDVARRFIPETFPVTQLRRLRDTSDVRGYDQDAWRTLCEMGWAGILAGEEFGGSAMGVQAALILAHEFGRSIAATPFLSSAVLAASALNRAGTHAQKQDHLPAIVSGSLYTFCSEEKAHHSPDSVATTLKPKGDAFQLNGRKLFVPHVGQAEWLVVTAQGDDGLVLVLVKADAPGVSIQKIVTVDSHNVGHVVFENVTISASSCLAGAHGGQAIERVLDAGRVFLAGELVGISREVFERTLQYARGRAQFGRLIGTFQALQHRLADLHCEIEVTASLVNGAANAIDEESERASLLASMAKAKASRLARRATAEAIQMHGGIGMTDEFDLGFFMKRGHVAGQLMGDAHFHDDRIARLKGI